LLLFVDVIYDKPVRDIVHEAHPKHPDNEFEKMIVILLSDAII